MKDVPNSQYISFNRSNNNWVIQKRINGKLIHFGYYLTLKEARKYRDYFIKNDWDTTFRLKFSKKRKEGYIEQLPNGKWIIRKTIKGERLTWGIFTDYESAEEELNKLRMCDWDYSALCESLDERINGMKIINNKVIV